MAVWVSLLKRDNPKPIKGLYDAVSIKKRKIITNKSMLTYVPH
jgi:hypothetical protein